MKNIIPVVNKFEDWDIKPFSVGENYYPSIDELTINFIQIYAGKEMHDAAIKPRGGMIPRKQDIAAYLRVGPEPHRELLENFLKEINIDKKSEFIAPREHNKYEIVGAGGFAKGYGIIKGQYELEKNNCLVVLAKDNDFCLYPSVKHLSKMIPHINKKIIFSGDYYFTEENKPIWTTWQDDLSLNDEREPTVLDIEICPWYQRLEEGDFD